jgi:SAM-dependent methyltransferase
MSGDSLWEEHSAWWQSRYTAGADAEYEEQILPLVQRHLVGARRVLDVGCGEGQVARHLVGPGTEVVGIDPTRSQIRTAYQRGGSARFTQARAEQLPCPTDAFDTVVLCLALEHVHPFEPAIDEVARVLAPGGTFLLLLVHPLLQTPESGWVDNELAGEQYWRIGPYLPDDYSVDEIEPGIRLPFAHRPLSRYVHAMGATGLLIEDMEEPSPPPTVMAETGGFRDAATIPRLLLVRARNLGPPASTAPGT